MNTIVISDMHINEQPKMRRTNPKLRGFLEMVAKSTDILIVAGDGIERLTFNDYEKLNLMLETQLLKDIQEDGRLILLHGNHDEKQDGLSLEYYGNEYEDDRIFVWHGHQYDSFCKNGWWDNLGMVFVVAWRWIFKRNSQEAEVFSSIVKEVKRQSRFNKKMVKLAKKKKLICLCGHTHERVMEKGDGWVYINVQSWTDEDATYASIPPDGPATLVKF